MVKEAPHGQTPWAPAKVGDGPRGPSPRTSIKVGEAPPGPPTGDAGRSGRPRTNNCLAYNMRGHVFRACPRLDAGTKALSTKVFL